MKAEELFLEAINRLRKDYNNYKFYVERDIVLTVQTMMNKLIDQYNCPLQVHNDFSILPKQRADLVVLGEDMQIELAVEFKYEPSHRRTDIVPTKFPVASWSEIGKDIDRIQRYVLEADAYIAYSILIDEGGHFRSKPAFQGSEWIEWVENQISILQSVKRQINENISHLYY
ncbi:hypothetical protein [Cytobacillus sp. NCCP-133]|uniref:hypothetical protein n=1 Tax=Cytobacillus sp. NCCP-133 TaxID=766848 RepID=UPI00222E4166|nr:hypothetical protein [Cytobacillus sp. NCCP-133]GLB59186.1 hypothetical protein NCCP133_13190 [Cytobacillus sp. NCCP-133]